MATIEVVVTDVGKDEAVFIVTKVAPAVAKFVPVIVIGVPTVAICGVKLVIVGTPLLAVTVNGVLLVAEPARVVTLIGPVVAPVGTVTSSWDVVAPVTVAVTPLNRTVFWLGVTLKPVPKIRTEESTRPLLGVNAMIETLEASVRLI